MDDITFWALIDKLNWSHQGDDDKVVEPVVQALSELPEAEIIDFERIFTQKLYDLDGRAWARESGDMIWWAEPDDVSADGFLYIRSAVVANGRDTYEAIVNNPPSMFKNMEFEALMYVAKTAYERRTGSDAVDVRDLVDLSYETFSNRAGWESD